MQEFRSKVLSRISERAWKSERRRSYLQRLATLTVGSKVRVDFDDIPTASCEWDGRKHKIKLFNSEYDMTKVDRYHQKLGSGKVHSLTQEGMLYHELGHVLISDFDEWDEALNRYDSLMLKDRAKQLINCVEDVVLEAWIRDHFNCGRILDFKNQVKFHCNYGLHMDDDKAIEDFYASRASKNPMSLMIWVVETYGRYNAGIDWEDRLSQSALDIRARVIEMVSDALKEPNAKKRYNLILDAFDDIREDHQISGEPDDNPSSEMPQSSSQISQEDIESMVEDGSGEEGEEGEDGEEEAGGGSGEPEEGEEEEEGSGSGTGESDEDPDEKDESAGVGVEDGESENEESQEDESGGSFDGEGEEGEDPSNDQFSEDELDQLVDESEVADGQDVSDQELDEKVKSLSAAGAGGGSDNIVDNTFGESDLKNDSYKKEARKMSRHVQRVLNEYLRSERKTQHKRGQDHGDFDAGKMIDADRGSTDVFKRRNKPGEKAYHLVILMDDSSSMMGRNLEAAIIGTTALTRAAEEVGIDVTVYRFGSDIRLVKSADQSYDEAEEMITEDRTYGGTTLLPVLNQLPELTREIGDESFLCVVSDGRPTHQNECVEKLQSLNMKKICLQIEDRSKIKEGFDGVAYADSSSDVRSAMQSLFRRVIL